MKLLMITAAFPPLRAGESDHALQLATRLATRGIDVHVLTTVGSEAPVGSLFTICPLIQKWSWLDLSRLAQFMKQCGPEAILLMYSGWTYHDHPMITFLPTIAHRLLPKARFVTQLEIGDASPWNSLPTRVVRKLLAQWITSKGTDYGFGTLLRDSDRLIMLSEHHLRKYSDLLTDVKGKSDVIPPPPILPMCKDAHAARTRGRSLLHAKQEEFLLAFYGYIDPTKGVETLFKAVRLLKDKARSIRLIMVGGGRGVTQGISNELGKKAARYEEEVLGLPEKLEISSYVTWTPGYEAGSDEGSMYLHAVDAVVLPFNAGVTLSRSSFAAAAAHGLPIVTTKAPCLESPFRDRDNVLLCPPNDPESLASAIEVVMDDPTLRQHLRDGVIKLAHEWFSWECAIDKTVQALDADSTLPSVRPSNACERIVKEGVQT